MKIQKNEPPREFEVGWGQKFTMKDCAHIELAANEQVTFKTDNGGEYDVARKDWGFYATPSINSRLERFGLRAMLVGNKANCYYVMLVEDGKEREFARYVEQEELTVYGLMNSETLPILAKACSETSSTQS